MAPLICFIVVLTILYLTVRIVEVDKFKRELAYKCYIVCNDFIRSIPKDRDTTWEEEEHYDRLKDTWKSIEAISRYKMIFSFKPLKEEVWLNEEQLRFIYGL